ncbi:MAG: N-acetyltransferase [Planctomycetaceae bacterium]|nr:MAG: N-acetyltransferase [Planctomycetaceae bacterium]
MKTEGPVIEIRRLGPFEIRRYSHFAAAVDLTYLAAGTSIAIGAEADGRPAGLALAHFVRPTAVRVAALTVEEPLRGKGVGSLLSAQLEVELAARGVILADVIAGNPHPFLQRQGWQPGGRLATVYTFSERVGESPWLRSPVNSPSYELFPWLGHTLADRQDALRLMESDTVARCLNPFTDPARVYGPCSHGIRHAGELVGWCVTHRVISGVLHYSSVYVAPRHRRTVAPLIVMGESIREHLRRSEELPTGVQAVPPELLEIERFASKRLAPWADKIERLHVWWKSFAARKNCGESE